MYVGSHVSSFMFVRINKFDTQIFITTSAQYLYIYYKKLLEDGQDKWSKHVRALYIKYKIIVQIVRSKFVCIRRLNGRCTTSNKTNLNFVDRF